MELFKLAVQLVQRAELDLTLAGAGGEGLLDRALNVYSLYLARPEWSFDGVLTLLSKKLVEVLLEKGAEIKSDNDEYSQILASFH